MIDIGIGVRKQPSALIRIRRKIVQHILMNFFLQIDANSSVCANNFVGTNSGFRWDVTVWVGNAHVRRIIANGEVRTFYRSLDQFLKKFLLWRNCRRLLRQRKRRDQYEDKKDDEDRVAHRSEKSRSRSYQPSWFCGWKSNRK